MSSSELQHVISAQISAVKHIPYELLGSSTANKGVVVKGTVFGEVQETQLSTWATRGGKPQSQNPKVRLHFFLLNHSNPSSPVMSDMGVAMLDIRDLQVTAAARETWHSLSGGRRIEAAVISKLATNFPLVQSQLPERRSPSRKRRQSHPERAQNEHNQSATNPLLSSLTSESSALKLGNREDRQRIALTIAILRSRNTHLIQADSGTEAWFGYQLFGETVQTNKFRLDEESVPARNDIFSLDTDLGFLTQWLHDNTPLKVYLCTEGRVLAKAYVKLEDANLPPSSSAKPQPLMLDCPLIIPRQGQRPAPTDASVTVSVEIGFSQSEQGNRASGAPPVPEPSQHRHPRRPSKGSSAPSALPSKPNESVTRQCEVVMKQLQFDPPDDESLAAMVRNEGFYTCVQLNREVVYSNQSDDAKLECGEYGEIDITADIPHGVAVVSAASHILSVRIKCISTESRKVFAIGEESIELSWGTQQSASLPPRTVAVPLLSNAVGVGEAIVQLTAGPIVESARPLAPTAAGPVPQQTAQGTDTDNVERGNDQPFHEYRLLIEARSMRKMTAGGHYLAQYTYAHLGSSHPVRSTPALIQRNSEVELERGHCTYTVTMLPKRLHDTLLRHPLQIAVLQRDHLGETKVGDVVLDMGVLLRDATVMYRCPLTQQTFKSIELYNQHAERMAIVYPERKAKLQRPFPLRVYDAYLPIVDAVNAGKDQIGSLRVMLTLENLGPSSSVVPPPELVQPTAAKRESSPPPSTRETESTAKVVSPSEAREHDTTASARLQILQQQQEQAQAEAQRMKEEMQRMIALSAQAREAEAQRLAQLQKAQHEYERLEFKLRQALEETERRQRELKSAEEAMKVKHDQKMAELQLLQKRARDEARATVEVEKGKVAALEERVRGLQEDLQRTDKRYMDVVQEFEQYQQARRSHPEQKIREELALVRAQLTDCQARLKQEQDEKHNAEKEKDQYAAQLHRLAAALKHERAKNAVVTRQEAEQLRLEYLAREERLILDGNRQELSAIRLELDRLRENVDNTSLHNGLNVKLSHDRSETSERTGPRQQQHSMQEVRPGSAPVVRKPNGSR